MKQRINILDQVKSSLLESGLRGPLILAYSGGLDSSALLHLLNQCDLELIIAHCNFQLRVDEADRDEEFCKKQAETLGHKFYVKRFDTLSHAAEGGISVQMAARDLRYEFFRSLKDEKNAEGIAVASHLDDQLETFLIKLGRGAGPGGLKGMEVWDGVVFRPLLKLSRDELESYVTENDIRYVEDSSNTTDDYERNYLRHHVIPKWKEIKPNLLHNFQLSRGYLEQMSKFTGEMMMLIHEHVRLDEHRISIGRLLEYPDEELFLFHWLHEQYGFNKDQIKSVSENLMSTESKEYESELWKLTIERNELVIEAKSLQIQEGFEIEPSEGVFNLEEDQLEISLEPGTGTLDGRSVYFDRDSLGAKLKFRHWEKGDRFQPLGMEGSKKLSDLFVDRKVNQSEKDRVWLMESGGEIHWVVGIQQSEISKVKDSTKRVLRLRFLN